MCQDGIKRVNLIKTQRALSPTQISIAPFVVNPYRGCTMGCIYCYARNNKVLKDKGSWGRFLEVKENIVSCLLRELETNIPSRVLVGSVCEPFVREERIYGLTRACLQILNDFNIPYTILTRSVHIQDALDIIGKNKKNRIYFTVNFLRGSLKRRFEPFIDYSLKDMLKLFEVFRERDINFRIHISPLIGRILNLEEVIINFLEFTKDFFLEVYNPLMGSWSEVKKVLREVFPQRYEETAKIFEDASLYEDFRKHLENDIGLLRGSFSIALPFFIPVFKSFYTPDITYE